MAAGVLDMAGFDGGGIGPDDGKWRMVVGWEVSNGVEEGETREMTELARDLLGGAGEIDFARRSEL